MVFPTIMPANSVSGFNITNSLRFNDGDSPQLNLANVGTVTNNKIFTYSVWIKKSSIESANQSIISAESGNNRSQLLFRSGSNDAIRIVETSDAYTSFNTLLTTAALFRDPSAWYHIVLSYDSTDGTAGDRVKIYVNSVLQTLSGTTADEDFTTPFNEESYNLDIGHLNNSEFLDGHMSDAHFIDGQALTPTSFGETNDNGVWIPKRYTGTFGLNGFKLEFKQTGTSTNSSGIGADTSGNDRHFAVSNLAATDITEDTPTNNFATMNPLLTDTTTVAFSEGNLKIVATNASTAGSSIAVQNGKWYVEMICTAKTATNALMGISTVDGFDGQRQLDESQNGGSGHGYVMNATKLPGGASYGATWAVDDIMAIALDLDTAQNTVTFYKNNASQGAIDIDNALYVFATGNGQGSATVTMNINFGADDTFAGEITSAGNTDANGEGLFKYAPPSGYFALNTKNLAEYG